MDILIGVVIGLLIAIGAGVILMKRAERALERDINTLVEAIQSEAAKNIIQARVEQHGGVFYVYNTANDHFLAQGNSVAELRSILELRFQDKRIFVTEGEQDVIDRLKSTVPPANLETDHA